MKRSASKAIGILVGCVILITGLGVWNFIQSRRHMLSAHAHWVDRVSARVMAERLSASQSLIHLQRLDRRELKRTILTRDDMAGAYWFDVRTHEFERWVAPDYATQLRAPDPRLVLSQLHAAEANAMRLGPVLLIRGSLFNTVAFPLDKRHAIVVVQEAPEIKKILDEEAAWEHLRVFVYDTDRHPLYVRGNEASIGPAVADTLTKSEAGATAGSVPLQGRRRWEWAGTFHTSPMLEWVFIVVEPTPIVYLPIVLYLITLFALLWLVRQPWKASATLRRSHEAAELKHFAIKVDRFIRGKELTLAEPPYPYNELGPIVQAVRWLMPQWKKAEAYPVEFGLERKLLSLLIESLPEGILFFNSQGALQLGNELGKVFLALQQEPGRDFKIVNGVQIPRGFLEPFAEPVFTGQQMNVGKEIEVGWADGKHLYRVWVESVLVEDKVEGFIVVVRDITFRKQWEYMQEQVLSGITHDLRGPLSAIMGYLDLLKRQLKEGSPPKAVEYVGLAREAGTRLTQMISDILDVVRFEQGKIDLEVQAVPVEDLFERVRNIFGVTAGQKNVELKLIIGERRSHVLGDRKLLERVLDNLVGNAIKFTPAGGVITVSADREHARTVFSVSDTGRGIPKEAQSRIFDKFQQVRPGDRSSGYGLGLAVVKFIVEAHKGEIRLDSALDKGSTFTFWVPDQPVTSSAGALREAS